MDKERVAAARQQTDQEWHEALNRHPDLKSRMVNLLALVDSADVALTDEAERRAIQELRGMGQEALNAWAQSRAGRACSQTSAAEAFKDGAKKVQWHGTYGVIEVEESCCRLKRLGTMVRPCSAGAQVHARGYSAPLQEAIADFGVDEPFAKVAEKVRRHYGIDISTSAARTVTLVRKACQHLSNRRTHLDYKKGGVERELPIRPGEIESGHRQIVQKRIKRSAPGGLSTMSAPWPT